MLARPGLRVVRGPHWRSGNEDGGEGHVGTVCEISQPEEIIVQWDNGTRTRCKFGQMGKYDLKVIDNAQVDGGVGHVGTVCEISRPEVVVVQWDNGTRTRCSVGEKGKYELRVIDNAQVGIKHPDISCDGCEIRPITGMRYKCTICNDYDLCYKCYHSDKHDISHPFKRFDSLRLPFDFSCEGVHLRPREMGRRCILSGKMGRVVKIHDWNNQSSRSAAIVHWFSGTTRRYRLGYNGKCDIKLVKASSGGTYYPGDLPLLGRSVYRKTVVEPTQSEPLSFTVGDKVQLAIAVKKFNALLSATVDEIVRAPKSTECLICSEITEENVKLEPCGHKLACDECSARINKCLICSTFVQKRVAKNGTIIPAKSPQQSAEMMRYLETKIAEIEESHTCSICMDGKRDVVFLCGHGTCQKCARTLRWCHICRKMITKKIVTY